GRRRMSYSGTGAAFANRDRPRPFTRARTRPDCVGGARRPGAVPLAGCVAMDEQGRALSRGEISEAVSGHGWRDGLGQRTAAASVGSLTQALQVAARVVAVAGPDAGDRLSLDVRARQVLLSVQSPASESATAADIDLARRITAVVAALGLSQELGPQVA